MKKQFLLALLSLATCFATTTAIAQKPTQQLPKEISESQIKNHVFSPDNVRGVEDDSQVKEFNLKIAPAETQMGTSGTKSLKSNKFATAFHNQMKDEVTGYVMQLRKNGQVNQTLIWNWGKTPANGGQGWTLDTRMHVASVSKTITGIAMYKLLLEKGISLDAKIINYLPTYWAKGPKVNLITFRHLLNHTSGFDTGNSASDFMTMKSRVAAGVPGVGGSKYANMNFGLCRILISVINGNVPVNSNWGLLNDNVWDMITVNSYKNYCQAKIFSPAGVANADFAPNAGTAAFAYRFPHNNQDGWNSGSLSSMSGGAGWRLSVKETLQVMDHLRRKNTILSPANALFLLNNRLGLDRAFNTPAGMYYDKNGLWRSNSRTEQCVAAFLPEGYEIVVFVNSPIGVNGASLRNLVRDVYLSSLE